MWKKKSKKLHCMIFRGYLCNGWENQYLINKKVPLNTLECNLGWQGLSGFHTL